MAKKTETIALETNNSVDALQAKIASMREAQKKFASFTHCLLYTSPSPRD